MKTFALALTFLAGLPLALSAQVSKEDIKKLAAAGISEDVIVSYIRANGPVAKLTADDVVELKQAGASEKLLTAVLGVSSAAPAPAPRQTYTPPATTYVYTNTTPYYYTPSTVYTSDYDYPTSYYYPRTYSYSTYSAPRYYSSYSSYCAPRYYSSPSISFGFSSGGRHYGHSSHRGGLGVSAYIRR